MREKIAVDVVRLAVWHGYLLADTGSNVFTRELVRALAGAGHSVTLFCQDPEGESRAEGAVRVVRPAIGSRVPVFVEDTYPDLEPRHVARFTATELDRYVAANAAAIARAIEEDGIEFVLANHAVMGGPVARAGCRGSTPYAVYVHGSELEYAIRGRPAVAELARHGLAAASVLLAGSAHIERATAEVLAPWPDPRPFERVSPGVAVDRFAPGRGSMEELCARLDGAARGAAGGRTADPDAGSKLRGVDRFVLFAGKLMKEKGVDVLLDAWRTLAPAHPGTHLVIAGFGPLRDEAERAAAGLPVVLTGALTHDELQLLMPLAEAVVVPSVMPEAFGMIAAEAAACGVVSVVADHSGLREVAEVLGDAAVTFDGSAEDLGERVAGVLALGSAERTRLRAAARERALAAWSWDAVAGRVGEIAASAVGRARPPWEPVERKGE